MVKRNSATMFGGTPAGDGAALLRIRDVDSHIALPAAVKHAALAELAGLAGLAALSPAVAGRESTAPRQHQIERIAAPELSLNHWPNALFEPCRQRVEILTGFHKGRLARSERPPDERVQHVTYRAPCCV